MTPDVVLDMARDAGLTIRADGDALVFRPVERLTPELRAMLVQHKPALLGYLRQAANDPGDDGADPARWCWPAVQELDAPMNPREVETFTARVLLFMRRGLAAGQADTLTDRLKTRDREGDTRRCCLECSCLTRFHTCTAWRKAGIGSERPGTDLLGKLQRCPAWAAAIVTAPSETRPNPA
jgi:hypothetical protein